VPLILKLRLSQGGKSYAAKRYYVSTEGANDGVAATTFRGDDV
jgi:hypothetical protein